MAPSTKSSETPAAEPPDFTELEEAFFAAGEEMERETLESAGGADGADSPLD